MNHGSRSDSCSWGHAAAFSLIEFREKKKEILHSQFFILLVNDAREEFATQGWTKKSPQWKGLDGSRVLAWILILPSKHSTFSFFVGWLVGQIVVKRWVARAMKMLWIPALTRHKSLLVYFEKKSTPIWMPLVSCRQFFAPFSFFKAKQSRLKRVHSRCSNSQCLSDGRKMQVRHLTEGETPYVSLGRHF